jgi:hypothetical protein
MRLLLVIVLLTCLSVKIDAKEEVYKYSTPDNEWAESFGNHRAVLNIKSPAEVISLDFLWRRHDLNPDSRRFIIVEQKTGDTINNIFRVKVNNDNCSILFGPVANPGTYFFYYLPYTPVTDQYSAGLYLTKEKEPDKNWVDKNFLSNVGNRGKRYPDATVVEVQARNLFHSFYPMEVVATEKEVDQLGSGSAADSYHIFPEDRKFPIRMNDALPYRWIQNGPSNQFSGEALRNEYYCFQLGIFAPKEKLENVKVLFSDLKDNHGNIIPKSALTCFNTEGINPQGEHFDKTVTIAGSRVQPFWIGVDVSRNTNPGLYLGTITIRPENQKEKKVQVKLTVKDQNIEDRGDNETWRHSRLRWLNSTLGLDDHPVLPYTPMTVKGNRISCLGRSALLNSSGFPESIDAWGREMLSSSIGMVIECDNQEVRFSDPILQFKDLKDGKVTWTSEAENDRFRISCMGKMEYDGRITYSYTLSSKINQHVQDVRLVIPFKKESATYMVGMGRMGGFTPASHISRWLKTEDSFWIGETWGGIQCELRGGTYHGPLRNLYQPDPSPNWYNGVNGGFRIDSDQNSLYATGYSGARKMNANQSVSFEFALLIAPVKKFDLKSQFTNRYFHATEPTPEVIENGGNVMNVHHANKYNPYINYPFIAQKEMRGLVDQWHSKGWKVKIYYTVRELSNHLTEIWALRSLGTEVLADGNGGGYQWLQEHLVKNYTPQWYTHLGAGEVDAAILNGSESRWYNYYVEGLNWLIKNMDIDGLYLDDVSFDRNILSRLRKVMEMNKPGCMIDLHSNTAFSLGSANQNLELYPFIDRTWFGEGFNFDLMPPEFWLTEISGIPFGIPNEQLLHMATNTHRGMLYAMTHRGDFPMWKLWDDFGISEADLVGYWNKEPLVKTENPNIYSSIFTKNDKVLVIHANWSMQTESFKPQFDWVKLGLNPDKVKVYKPEIKGYQLPGSVNLNEPLQIKPKDDVIYIIEELP